MPTHVTREGALFLLLVETPPTLGRSIRLCHTLHHLFAYSFQTAFCGYHLSLSLFTRFASLLVWSVPNALVSFAQQSKRRHVPAKTNRDATGRLITELEERYNVKPPTRYMPCRLRCWGSPHPMPVIDIIRPEDSVHAMLIKPKVEGEPPFSIRAA